MKKLDEEQLKAVLRCRQVYNPFLDGSFREELTKEGLIDREPKLEVGKWYKEGVYMFCLTDINTPSDTPYPQTYGYGFEDEEWSSIVDTDSGGWTFLSDENIVEATDKEVTDALEREAIKRGYVDGAKVKCLYDRKEMEISGVFFSNSTGVLAVNQKGSTFLGQVIFKDGKWAKIMTEPEVKEVTMSELEKKYGCKIKIVK